MPREFRLQVAIAGVSGTLLALQVAFTRVLSVVVHIHMVFLVLSAAMLGVGLPGAWLLWKPPGSRTTVRALQVALVSIPASVIALLRFDSNDKSRTLMLAIICLLVPFLALGTAAAALLIEAKGPAFRKVYAADLLGGAAGALGVIALLDWVPTPMLLAALALPIALVIAWLGDRTDRAGSAVLALAVLALIVWGAPFHVRFTKAYDEKYLNAHIIAERWSSTTRLAVFDRPFFVRKDSFFTWGGGTKSPGSDRSQYWIEQDGGAGTPVIKFDGDLQKLGDLDYDVTSLGYQLRPAKSVLVVGPGGGRDILTALHQGAEHVRGVEVNRGMVELMTGKLAGFSGHLYADPRVDVTFAEARSFLARTDERFDALQISLIDSFTATSAGAYALSEGYLYTVEGIRTFLQRLRPQGVLSITRWNGEALRLIGTMSAAAQAEGWGSVGEHLFAQRAAGVVTVLASPTPFSAAERARAAGLAESRGWEAYYPGPDARPAECVGSRGTNCGRQPATDDDPFFFIREDAFSTHIWGTEHLEPIRRVAAFSVLGLVLCVFLPLYRERATVSTTVLRSGLYYVFIGIAFMFVEVGLAHRFVEYVGHPTTSASVVLAGLLLGAGAGSYVLPSRAGRGWLFTTSAVIAMVGFGAPVVFAATHAFSPLLRGFIAGLLAAAVAFQLGAWFPAGLLRWGEQRKAWFWLVNGTAGVVGGMLALGIAIDFGFRSLFAAAALLYLAAAALFFIEGEEGVAVTGAGS